MRVAIRVVGLFAVACMTSAVYAQENAANGSNIKLKPLPRPLEIRLALSAAPSHLRAEATVFVLDPAPGYVLERQGTNGFTCYVQRTDYTREDYGDSYFAAECQDAEGTKSVVPVEFDIERPRAEGKLGPAELKQEIVRRFKDGVYHSPARPGIAYMLSPVARLYAGPGSGETVAMNMPHYMLFMPNLTAKDIGAAPVMGPYPYFINPGPMAHVILNVGATEKAQIDRDSEGLLKEACAYSSGFCIKGVTPGTSATL
jgi:hypothetical protein